MSGAGGSSSAGPGSTTTSTSSQSSSSTGEGGGAVIPGDVLFFDDFEYVVDRAPTSPGDAFISEGGWNNFKDMRTSQNAGGYLYTIDAVPGFTGSFPGARSSRVLAIESRVGTEAPCLDGWCQTDFYVGYGDEGAGAIGDVPANLWIQFWIYQNDFGEQASQYSRSDKWIYPTRTYYPATEGSIDWLFLMGSASLEPHNIELGSGPDRFMKLIGTGADFTAASEYPTNASKLGANLDQNGFVARNTWRLVKIHIDTSVEQGTYEVWLRGVGEEWLKVSEWIGGVTPNFSWPIPAEYRMGHKMFKMPTTMNFTPNSGGGDSWTYMDDFALATAEDALPTYP